jgi:hypothetical protein
MTIHGNGEALSSHIILTVGCLSQVHAEHPWVEHGTEWSAIRGEVDVQHESQVNNAVCEDGYREIVMEQRE